MRRGAGGRQQVIVIDQNTEREQGRKAQLANIQAARAVSEVVRTCLGPRAMLKMILSNFGIVMTNDGNAILRELEVTHPAAKSMIELSRTQDEEVGDGTTSVIILAGEILTVAEPWIQRDMHPIVINRAFMSALDDSLACLERFSRNIGDDRTELLKVIETCIATKYIAKWSGMFCNIALDAVSTCVVDENGRREVDIKRYLQVMKIPGGEVGDSHVLKGVCINKDVVHASMRRRIENPRILLLDCNLEYKKGESQTDVELERPEQIAQMLRLEEEFVKSMCNDIIKWKPDLVITEKGLCDLAQHYFVQAGITGLRRFRRTDSQRIARAVGARIVHRTDEITEADIGTGCGLFEVRQIADEYVFFSYPKQKRRKDF
ncbi:MAG: T-complex protein 1 subunit gamma [archaeon]|nr:T-complex protein 1 subunit gamma [archaeon]